jgi:hypothetical protein
MRNSKNSCMPHGEKTIAKICGSRWPRIMSVRGAAAYAGFASVDSFCKVPELSALIVERFGKRTVDRQDLDVILNNYSVIAEACKALD